MDELKRLRREAKADAERVARGEMGEATDNALGGEDGSANNKAPLGDDVYAEAEARAQKKPKLEPLTQDGLSVEEVLTVFATKNNKAKNNNSKFLMIKCCL